MTDDQLTYKGFVCADGDKFGLIVKDTTIPNRFRSMPISGDKNKFDNVNNYAASIVAVKFFDGTEQISLEKTFEGDLDDIFISIKKTATIQFVSEKTVIEIVNSSYQDTVKIWEFVDEYFESEEGEDVLKRFVEKDVWNK
jgi:hypothetical protein